MGGGNASREEIAKKSKEEGEEEMSKKGIVYKNAKMKMERPGKKVKGSKYAADLEEEDVRDADEDNHPRRKPSDVAQAMKRAKEGYSKKPRVKADKKKQR